MDGNKKCFFCNTIIIDNDYIMCDNRYYCNNNEYDQTKILLQNIQDQINEIVYIVASDVISEININKLINLYDTYGVKCVYSCLLSNKQQITYAMRNVATQSVYNRYSYFLGILKQKLNGYKMPMADNFNSTASNLWTSNPFNGPRGIKPKRKRCLEDIDNNEL